MERTLDTAPDPEFDRLARLAAKLLGARTALISLIDDERQWFKSHIGITLEHVPRDRSICAHALGGVLVIGDATQDPRSRASPLVVGEPHARFYAGVALATADGLALGALCVLDSRPRAGLSAEQAETLRELGALAMTLIEARRTAQHPHVASHLPDRARFLDDIGTLIGAKPPVDRQIAVIVVEAATPDQYEELTRTLGQAATDRFEDASARSISEYLPAHTGLYNLSAGRFGCVLDVDDPTRIEEILDTLAYRMRRLEPAGRHIPAATSVGIGAACHPRHGATATALLWAAAAAAHDSVNSGDPWCFYSPTLDRASRRAAQLLRDIGTALAVEGQLHLVYQAKTALSSGCCIGAEALLRWNHPTLGAIPPGEFVPLIENTTLVHAVTEWTLRAALPQIALWRASGLDPQISVNVSMRDLGDDHFAARLAELLEHHAVRPEWIDIEVTESALMKDPARVRRQLDAVRRLGIAIEIDDYGTGQSGLSYLKFIPATYVKLAQLFIARLATDRNDQIMVRSTIDLAHDLGLKVVAEGIRDDAALGWLRNHGCDIGQGNAIAPPLEAPHFERLLRTPPQRAPLRR